MALTVVNQLKTTSDCINKFSILQTCNMALVSSMRTVMATMITPQITMATASPMAWIPITPDHKPGLEEAAADSSMKMAMASTITGVPQAAKEADAAEADMGLALVLETAALVRLTAAVMAPKLVSLMERGQKEKLAKPPLNKLSTPFHINL
jgi:hypothetical protein